MRQFIRRFIPGQVVDRVVSCHGGGESFVLTSRIGLITASDEAVMVGTDHEFPGSVRRVTLKRRNKPSIPACFPGLFSYFSNSFGTRIRSIEIVYDLW